MIVYNTANTVVALYASVCFTVTGYFTVVSISFKSYLSGWLGM